MTRIIVNASSTGNGAYSDNNGQTWTSFTSNAPYVIGAWNDIAYSGSTYVMLDQGSSKTQYSTNGTSWTVGAVTGLTGSSTNRITGNSTAFFVVTGASTNTAYRSTDGINWSSVTMPATRVWSEPVSSDSKMCVFVQNSNVFAYSTNNGTSWTEGTLPISITAKRAVFTGKYFVVLNNTTNQICISTDGTNWAASRFYVDDINTMSLVAGLGDTIIVTKDYTTSSYQYTTSSGSSWSTGTWPITWSPSAIFHNGTNFVAINDSATQAYYSSNGTTWTSTSLPSSSYNWQVLGGQQVFAQFYSSSIVANRTLTPYWNNLVTHSLTATKTSTPTVSNTKDLITSLTATKTSTPTVSNTKDLITSLTATKTSTPSIVSGIGYSVSISADRISESTFAYNKNLNLNVEATKTSVPTLGNNKLDYSVNLLANRSLLPASSSKYSYAETLDLSTYSAIKQASFIKFVTYVNGSNQTVLVSSHDTTVTIDGDVYSPVGSLLSVSDISSELKPTQSDVTFTLSGIPNGYMAAILDNPIKGSPVEIRRAFFNVKTGALLNVPGNPVLEFSGVINNFSVDEGWTDDRTQTVTSTISLSCSSIMSVLINKVSGRRTNQADQDYWFTGDLSMNRVSVISDATFDFGGTTPSAGISTPAGKTLTNTAI